MQGRLTVILAAGVVTGSIIGPARPSWATGSGGAWTEEAGVGARAADGGSPGPATGGNGTRTGGGGSAGGSRSACTSAALDARESRIAEDMVADGLLTKGGGPGSWQRVICPGSGVVRWVGARGPAAPVVDPRALALEALGRAPIPEPAIGVSPPAGEQQIVNLPTWLWVGGWQPVTATAAAGGVNVTVTATPDRVLWSMGNGDRVACAGPGRHYDPAAAPAGGQGPSCSYTYRAGSARAPGGTFRVSATITWRIAWDADGIAGAGDLPPVDRTSSVTVRVAEIQAVNQGVQATGGRQ